MSPEKPVIHKSAIARPVDYSNAQIEDIYFSFSSYERSSGGRREKREVSFRRF